MAPPPSTPRAAAPHVSHSRFSSPLLLYPLNSSLIRCGGGANFYMASAATPSKTINPKNAAITIKKRSFQQATRQGREDPSSHLEEKQEKRRKRASLPLPSAPRVLLIGCRCCNRTEQNGSRNRFAAPSSTFPPPRQLRPHRSC